MKKAAWTIPFISFIAGYILMSGIIHVPTIETPLIVGSTINDAIIQLSQLNLNAKVINQKIDPDCQEGTIISQTPKPGSRIKPNQSIFLVITKQPDKPIAPNICGLNIDQAKSMLEKQGLKAKFFYIYSQYPKDTCIAQWPNGHDTFNQTKNNCLIAYISANQENLKILPDFRTLDINLIKEKLSSNNIEFIINSSNNGQIVKEQRPLPGSFIDAPKGLKIHLQT